MLSRAIRLPKVVIRIPISDAVWQILFWFVNHKTHCTALYIQRHQSNFSVITSAYTVQCPPNWKQRPRWYLLGRVLPPIKLVDHILPTDPATAVNLCRGLPSAGRLIRSYSAQGCVQTQVQSRWLYSHNPKGRQLWHKRRKIRRRFHSRTLRNTEIKHLFPNYGLQLRTW